MASPVPPEPKPAEGLPGPSTKTATTDTSTNATGAPPAFKIVKVRKPDGTIVKVRRPIPAVSSSDASSPASKEPFAKPASRKASNSQDIPGPTAQIEGESASQPIPNGTVASLKGTTDKLQVSNTLPTVTAAVSSKPLTESLTTKATQDVHVREKHAGTPQSNATGPAKPPAPRSSLRLLSRIPGLRQGVSKSVMALAPDWDMSDVDDIDDDDEEIEDDDYDTDHSEDADGDDKDEDHNSNSRDEKSKHDEKSTSNDKQEQSTSNGKEGSNAAQAGSRLLSGPPNNIRARNAPPPAAKENAPEVGGVAKDTPSGEKGNGKSATNIKVTEKQVNSDSESRPMKPPMKEAHPLQRSSFMIQIVMWAIMMGLPLLFIGGLSNLQPSQALLTVFSSTWNYHRYLASSPYQRLSFYHSLRLGG